LEQSYAINSGYNFDSIAEDYRGFTFRLLPEPNILTNVWGNSFPSAKEYWYTQSENYVIMANNPEDLRSWVNFYSAGRVLASNRKYKTISSDLSEKTNFYLYSALARSAEFIKKEVNQELAENIKEHEPILRKFQSLSVQFSNNGRLFYNNLCLKFDPVYEPEFNSLWEFSLDTTVFAQPWSYYNPVDSSTGFVVQDISGKLYRLDENGKLIWKIQLPEKVYGNVTQIGPMRNEEWQLMFAGKKSIYKISSSGKYADGFPVNLDFEPTCTPGIYDYEKDGNPFILAATSELKVVKLLSDGKRDKKWRTESLKDTLLAGFDFFKVNGRKVAFFIDKSGFIKLIDTEGNWVEKVKEAVPDYLPTRFCLVKSGDINRCKMYAVNGLGELMEINFKGKISKRSLPQSWSGDQLQFIAGNIVGDKKTEFVFAFNNLLRVYDDEYEPIIEKTFGQSIIGQPQIIQINDSTSRLVVKTKGQLGLQIISAKGKLNFETPINGNLPVSVLSVESGRFNFLVSASEKKISAFAVEPDEKEDIPDQQEKVDLPQ
jgi:hypothetical protein